MFLLGLLNFYGHHVEEILKIYLFTSFQLHDILCVWNMACWIFLGFRLVYHPEGAETKLSSLKKKMSFAYIFAIKTVQALRNMFMCLYTSSKGKSNRLYSRGAACSAGVRRLGTRQAEVSARFFLWCPAAMLVPMRIGTNKICNPPVTAHGHYTEYSRHGFYLQNLVTIHEKKLRWKSMQLCKTRISFLTMSPEEHLFSEFKYSEEILTEHEGQEARSTKPKFHSSV